MARVALTTHSLRVRLKNHRDDLMLDDLDGRDFADLFHEYLQDRTANYQVDEDDQKIMIVARSAYVGREFSGVLATGEYGYETDIVNVTDRLVSYRRGVNEADVIPYYFRLNVPPGRDEALLVLQRFQQGGITTVLTKDLKRWFEQHAPEYTVRIKALMAPEVWRAYLGEGRLLTVRFVRFRVPDDIARAVRAGGHVEDIGTVEYVVRARRKGVLPFQGAVEDFIDGKRHWNDFIELDEFEFESVKIEVDFHGSRRTIELKDVRDQRAVYDISEEVDYGTDGHPLFESIDVIARGYAGDIRDRAGVG
jgi:hypothetical protein